MTVNWTDRLRRWSHPDVYPALGRAPGTPAVRRIEGALRCWFIALAILTGFLIAFPHTPSLSQEKIKGKVDIFRGTLVAAGPKAITVKSLENIYHLRTFNYSPELEKKMPKKKLVPGQKVTVHYVRGTNWAVKVD